MNIDYASSLSYHEVIIKVNERNCGHPQKKFSYFETLVEKAWICIADLGFSLFKDTAKHQNEYL
jgi:hypothetical protein